MFPSGNCGIDPMSPFPLSNSFLGHENPLFPQNPNYLQNSFPSFVEPFSNGLNMKQPSLSYESDIPREMPRKKKDMPRKIITAKGPRERRVRLSLNVARKFFDLQDMLGFDKASKTLDWLLGKSNPAIEELMRVDNRFVMSKSGHAESTYGTCEYEDLSDQTNEDLNYMSSDFTRYGRSSTSSFHLVGKESRSKARERARKRTKEKMGTTRACDKMHLSSSCPSLNQIEVPYLSETMMSNVYVNEEDSCFTISQAQRTCTTVDSMFINKSLLKPFSITNTASSSIDYQNWENIGMFAPQSFCYVQNSPPETEFRNC